MKNHLCIIHRINYKNINEINSMCAITHSAVRLRARCANVNTQIKFTFLPLFSKSYCVEKSAGTAEPRPKNSREKHRLRRLDSDRRTSHTKYINKSARFV